MGNFTKGQTIFLVVLIVLLIGLDVFSYIYFKNSAEDLWVVSDINQIRSALEINYAINTEYPAQDKPLLLNSRDLGSEKLCLQNFASLIQSCQIILGRIPNSLGAAINPYYYGSANPKEDYQLQFSLHYNNNRLGLSSGLNCASRTEIRPGTCFAENQ